MNSTTVISLGDRAMNLSQGCSHVIPPDGVDSFPYLDVSFEDSGIDSISRYTLHAIWNKAERLLSTPGRILNVPWTQK